MTASENQSKKRAKPAEPGEPGILERIQAYAMTHPNADKYWLRDGTEGSQILVAVAQQIDALAEEVDPEEAHLYRTLAFAYLEAAAGDPLAFIQNMDEEDQLEICGLTILAPIVYVH